MRSRWRRRFLLSEGRTDEALKSITLAVDANPKDPDAQILLGKTYLARLQFEEAETRSTRPRNSARTTSCAQIELAKLHLQRGEVGTAIEFVDQALETDPANIEAQLTLVRGLIAQADFQRAKTVLKALLVKAANAVEVQNAVGALALATNNNASARVAWERALSIDPNNVDALSGLAALSMAAKRPSEARSLVEGRLAKRPDDEGLLLLAVKVRIATHDAKGAEAALRHLVEIAPQNLQAYALLGQMFVAQKRIADAKTEYLTVIQQRPGSVPAFTMMGLLAEAENNVPQAVDWYQKAVQIDWRSSSVAREQPGVAVRAAGLQP